MSLLVLQVIMWKLRQGEEILGMGLAEVDLAEVGGVEGLLDEGEDTLGMEEDAQLALTIHLLQHQPLHILETL